MWLRGLIHAWAILGAPLYVLPVILVRNVLDVLHGDMLPAHGVREVKSRVARDRSPILQGKLARCASAGAAPWRSSTTRRVLPTN